MSQPIVITGPNGRKRIIPEHVAAEWLDDLPAYLDERLSQPLGPADRLAFCAPEIIRAAAASEFLNAKLADHKEDLPC